MPVQTKKIIILYASYGDGHIQVSKALKQAFERNSACEIVLVDLFAKAYPKLNELTKYIYIKSYTYFPNLYGWSYYSTSRMRNETFFSRWFNSWGIRTLKQIVELERPDCVINTFPMLAMPELLRKTGWRIPTYNVITDFTLHHRWIHPFIDKYYTATDDLKRQIVQAGIPEQKVTATGIPLKHTFQLVERTAELFQKYGVDPHKRTVLIMAGSYGVLSGLTEVCRVLDCMPNVQLLVVCGKNKALYETVNASLSGRSSAKVFGFVEEMHELMALADTMVTKPGGITLSEAIQCGLPVVLFRPVPGQERENALYLQRKGAALIASDTASLLQCIRDLLENDEKREQAVRSIAELRKSNATSMIVQDIVASIEDYRSNSVISIEQRRVTSERFT